MRYSCRKIGDHREVPRAGRFIKISINHPDSTYFHYAKWYLEISSCLGEVRRPRNFSPPNFQLSRILKSWVYFNHFYTTNTTDIYLFNWIIKKIKILKNIFLAITQKLIKIHIRSNTESDAEFPSGTFSLNKLFSKINSIEAMP